MDKRVYGLLGVDGRRTVPADEIQTRCSLQMVNEALRCLGEGVIRSARDGDVAAVVGLGFPPFRGGPFHYVDLVGASEILRRVETHHERFGKRWEPAPVLVDMAKDNGLFFP